MNLEMLLYVGWDLISALDVWVLREVFRVATC